MLKLEENLKEVREASGMTEVPTKREVTKVSSNLKRKDSY
jgi:hypothetical protein